METLQKVLETNNKSIYEVPPNGDCGYHSVIEMMNLKNIFPVNFQEDNVLMMLYVNIHLIQSY